MQNRRNYFAVAAVAGILVAVVAASAPAAPAASAGTSDLGLGGPEPGPAGRGSMQYDRSILDDSARPEQERERDGGSKPLEVYAWLGIASGMTVGDVIPSAGYNTHILSRIVGDEGRVLGAYGRNMEQLQQRAADSGLANVEVMSDLSEVADGSVDVYITVRNIHDVYLFNMDRDGMYADILRTLKPGGILGVVDARTPNEGAEQDTHRINEDLVVRDLEAAGFELLEKSDLLAMPDDDYSSSGFPNRWEVDRFLLKFRKS